MHPPVDALAAVQWPLLSILLASVLWRSDEDFHPGLVVEVRVSVTRSAVPGVALTEFELIDSSGQAVAGGSF